jgi:hypothetical protein
MVAPVSRVKTKYSYLNHIWSKTKFELLVYKNR